MGEGARLRSRPTLGSLARELGLSRQTVSNVLNNPDVVTESTRRRVLAAIEAAGYRPPGDGAAGTKRSMAIALRLYPAGDGVNGALMDRFTHRITECAQQHGYRVTLFSAREAADELRVLSQLHRDWAIEGAVLTDTFAGDPRPAQLQARGIPFVAFGRPWGGDLTGHSWVDVDGRAGTMAATAHLRALGHRRIGYIGPVVPGVCEDRHSGWQLGMAGTGFAPATWRRAVEFDTARSGADAARSLQAQGATALVCGSDTLAFGAVTALRRAGALLPVIGFDDTPVARALGISSVAQPVEAAAQRLVETLLGQEPGLPTRQVLLEPHLVLRNLEQFAS
jgi:DNA-binding LacI/PurR family transcriptional regulator